jgi:hypothetical protein
LIIEQLSLGNIPGFFLIPACVLTVLHCFESNPNIKLFIMENMPPENKGMKDVSDIKKNKAWYIEISWSMEFI